MSELSNIEMKNTELISTVLLNIGKLFNRRGYRQYGCKQLYHKVYR